MKERLRHARWRSPFDVMAAAAAIHASLREIDACVSWMPACAGMTIAWRPQARDNAPPSGSPEKRGSASYGVFPAKRPGKIPALRAPAPRPGNRR